MHPSASAVWPPTGIALAALLLWGLRLWPGVAIGAFLVNVTNSGSVTTSLAIAVGNTLEALLGAYLVERFAGGARAFERPQDVFKFGVLAALLATTLSAGIGTAALAMGGLATPTSLGEIWLTWWLGDVAGAFIVTPAIILWSKPADPVLPARIREAEALFAAALLLSVFVFAGSSAPLQYRYPFELLATPLVVWAALRLGPRETATVGLLLSAVAVWGTVQDPGPFARAQIGESLLLLQAFMAVVSLVSMVLAADVLQRRRVEATLRSTEERLTLAEERRRMEQALAEAQAIAHLGSWEWDIPNNHITWSDELYRIYGVDPKRFDATYEAYLSLIHPEDRELARAVVSEAYRERKAFQYEHRIVRPDGEVRMLHARGRIITNEAGEVVRMVGTGHDVTELYALTKESEARAAAEQAAARTARLQTVTAALSRATTPDDVIDVMMNHGIAALGADAGSIVLLSEDAAWLDVVRVRGYPAEVTRGWERFPIEESVPLAECVRIAAPVWLESRDDCLRQFPGLGQGRQLIYDGAAAIPLLARGRAIGAMGLSFSSARLFTPDDRTLMQNLALQCALALERARLYEREQAARAAAEAAIKTREEFLSVAAHELRTPITSLRLNAQHLLRRLKVGKQLDPEQIQHALESFDVQTVRLARLVSQLLDVSRIEAGRLQLSPEDVDLGDLVLDVAERARLQAAEREIRVDTPPTAPAKVDPGRIEQVVTNLIDNALKYSPNDRPIEVTLRQDEPEVWELTVRDYGIGVPPEHRERIFDRFYQANIHQQSPGLGLGLYVSRQIVELHRGSLVAEFPEDGGSRFKVRLPARQTVR